MAEDISGERVKVPIGVLDMLGSCVDDRLSGSWSHCPARSSKSMVIPSNCYSSRYTTSAYFVH